MAVRIRLVKIVKPEMGKVIGTDGRWEKVYKLQLENLNAREEMVYVVRQESIETGVIFFLFNIYL